VYFAHEKEIIRTLRKIGYSGSLTMEYMFRFADPYNSTKMKTEVDLMDKYARQAIEYLRIMERSTET
jgi:sugar phosphate isomerase/epimerase